MVSSQILDFAGEDSILRLFFVIVSLSVFTNSTDSWNKNEKWYYNEAMVLKISDHKWVEETFTQPSLNLDQHSKKKLFFWKIQLQTILVKNEIDESQHDNQFLVSIFSRFSKIKANKNIYGSNSFFSIFQVR